MKKTRAQIIGPNHLLYLSAFFEKHRNEYYELLMKVSENGTWHEWAIFFLRGVEEQARDAIVRAKRLQDLQMEWKKRLSQAHVSAMVLRLVDSLFVSPLITIPEAQRISGVKQYHTARKGIERLVSVGILKQVGESSYGKSFIAEEILQTVGEGTKR